MTTFLAQNLLPGHIASRAAKRCRATTQHRSGLAPDIGLEPEAGSSFPASLSRKLEQARPTREASKVAVQVQGRVVLLFIQSESTYPESDATFACFAGNKKEFLRGYLAYALI